jgi:DNA-binding transcriptional LysR family regulator
LGSKNTVDPFYCEYEGRNGPSPWICKTYCYDYNDHVSLWFRNMTLEQLRIFAAVAERQHVTRAAEILGVTQSAASASIAALEQQFGLKLFNRIGRGINLTEAGTLLLAEARAVLARAQSAQNAMTEFSGLHRGRLTIHASQTIASYFLPRRLVRFHAAYPGIELAVSVSNTTQVARAILEGAAELGFVEGPVADPLLAMEPVAHDQMIVVVPPGHAWASGTKLSAAELLAQNWVLREDGSGTRAAFASALSGFGVDPEKLRIAITLPSNEAVRAAVEAGAGAAALSSLVCAESLAAGTLARANIALPTRNFYTVQHMERYRSRSVTALLSIIRESAGDGAANA